MNLSKYISTRKLIRGREFLVAELTCTTYPVYAKMIYFLDFAAWNLITDLNTDFCF